MAAAARAAGPAGDLAAVGRYYTRKIQDHGPTPPGVDWPDASSQHLRFAQLLRICDGAPASFSLNDFGCGYGALVRHLRATGMARVDYLGIDVSAAMVSQAAQLYPGAAFTTGTSNPRTADYTVASGVFNVKLRAARARWEAHAQSTVRQLFAGSRRGLAFNLLAPRPPHVPQPRELYRPDPGAWMAYCKETLGADVTLLADYGLGEYTLLLRRSR